MQRHQYFIENEVFEDFRIYSVNERPVTEIEQQSITHAMCVLRAQYSDTPTIVQTLGELPSQFQDDCYEVEQNLYLIPLDEFLMLYTDLPYGITANIFRQVFIQQDETMVSQTMLDVLKNFKTKEGLLSAIILIPDFTN